MSEGRKYDVLSTEIVNGEIRCKLGDSASNVGYVQDATFWGVDGFYSRPADPDDDGACMAVYVAHGNTRRIVATKDNRIVTLYGEIEPGDRAIVSHNGTCVLVKANGKVSVVTFNQQENDALMMFEVSGKDGIISSMVGGVANSSLVTQTASEWSVAAGGSGIAVNQAGVTINGNWFSCNTGGGNLGTIGGVAIPPAPAQSIIIGVSGQTGTPAPFWTVSSS